MEIFKRTTDDLVPSRRFLKTTATGNALLPGDDSACLITCITDTHKGSIPPATGRGPSQPQRTLQQPSSPPPIYSIEETKPTLGTLPTPTRVPFPRPPAGAHRNPNEPSSNPLHPHRSTPCEETKPTLGTSRTPTGFHSPGHRPRPIATPTNPPATLFAPTDPLHARKQGQLWVLYRHPQGFHSPGHRPGPIATPTNPPATLFTPTDPLHPRKQNQRWVLYGHPQGSIPPATGRGLEWYARDPRAPLSLLRPNGSALIGLPAGEANIRGFDSVSFLILDEAAKIPDEVYAAARPTRATDTRPVLS